MRNPQRTGRALLGTFASVTNPPGFIVTFAIRARHFGSRAHEHGEAGAVASCAASKGEVVLVSARRRAGVGHAE